MTHPKIVYNGVPISPLAVSQDGWQVRVEGVERALTLGKDFHWERSCQKCHRGLMPCCGRCPMEGHAETCQSEEARRLLLAWQAREVGR